MPSAAPTGRCLGHDGTRNGVSSGAGGPTSWCVEEREGERLLRGSHGVRWSTPLGLATFASPVVSDGLVWIGTNNQRPGVHGGTGHDSVLLCFRAADGKQVYEYVSPKLPRAQRRPRHLWDGRFPAD